jgi:DNA polymerase III alpha subunit
LAPIFVPDDVPYTAAQIREIEKELVGVYLSSTPFDSIPPEVLEDCRSADEIDTAPSGQYLIAATLSKVKHHRDRNNKDMGFLGMYAQTGDLDVTCFKGEWAKYHADFTVGRLCFAYVDKNDRGLRLLRYQPI